METVELTGKKWKTMKVYAGVLFVIGMLLMFSSAFGSASHSSPGVMILGVVCLFVALILGVWAAIGRWWHHA